MKKQKQKAPNQKNEQFLKSYQKTPGFTNYISFKLY